VRNSLLYELAQIIKVFLDVPVETVHEIIWALLEVFFEEKFDQGTVIQSLDSLAGSDSSYLNIIIRSLLYNAERSGSKELLSLAIRYQDAFADVSGFPVRWSCQDGDFRCNKIK
jgi:hypothetical protein